MITTINEFRLILESNNYKNFNDLIIDAFDALNNKYDIKLSIDDFELSQEYTNIKYYFLKEDKLAELIKILDKEDRNDGKWNTIQLNVHDNYLFNNSKMCCIFYTAYKAIGRNYASSTQAFFKYPEI